jgi:hypothetical protein
VKIIHGVSVFASAAAGAGSSVPTGYNGVQLAENGVIGNYDPPKRPNLPKNATLRALRDYFRFECDSPGNPEDWKPSSAYLERSMGDKTI